MCCCGDAMAVAVAVAVAVTTANGTNEWNPTDISIGERKSRAPGGFKRLAITAAAATATAKTANDTNEWNHPTYY